MKQALLALIATVISSPACAADEPRFLASVDLIEGKCGFLTGDVMFDLVGFRQELRLLDNKRGITIIHGTKVPERCVVAAGNAAREVGFRDIRSQIGRWNPLNAQP